MKGDWKLIQNEINASTFSRWTILLRIVSTGFYCTITASSLHLSKLVFWNLLTQRIGEAAKESISGEDSKSGVTWHHKIGFFYPKMEVVLYLLLCGITNIPGILSSTDACAVAGS